MRSGSGVAAPMSVDLSQFSQLSQFKSLCVHDKATTPAENPHAQTETDRTVWMLSLLSRSSPGQQRRKYGADRVPALWTEPVSQHYHFIADLAPPPLQLIPPAGDPV